MVISSHRVASVKLSPVKQNDVKGLREIFGPVESSIRNLNSLNVDQESYGTFLVHLLREKLPFEIRLIIAKTFGEEAWTLKVILEILNIKNYLLKNVGLQFRLKTTNINIIKKMFIQLAFFIIKIERFHVFFVNQITIHSIDATK